MDFLSCQNETLNYRVYLSSNETSSTLYIEELPNYLNKQTKLNVLSVYFYFKGNECFDILSLYKDICSKTLNFDQIKDFILQKLSIIKNDSFSYTSKKVDLFSIKPAKNTQIKICGKDFVGIVSWSFFFLISNKRDLCMCLDKESARRLFKKIITKQTDLNKMSYKNLINILYSDNFNIYSDN